MDNRQLDEIDSGLLSHESVLCSSCDYNNQQLEDVRKELVKVLLQSNQNSDKAKIDLEQANDSLFECQNKLKNLEKEAAQLKNDFKTKADQLKQKNKDLDSTKTRLDKSMKEIAACKENFNTKINNLQVQNDQMKTKIDQLKTDLQCEKSNKKK